MRAGYARTVELLTAEDRDAADLLEEAAPFALTHLDFPREHRNCCTELHGRPQPARGLRFARTTGGGGRAVERVLTLVEVGLHGQAR